MSHSCGFAWLCPAFQGSKFKVQGSMFRVHHKHLEYNPPLAPLSGWSGRGLVPPWYLPIPIEPSQTPIFDQPSLSRPLSSGISAPGRFRCGTDLWSAGARSLRLGGPCSAKLDHWAASPRLSAFCFRLNGVQMAIKRTLGRAEMGAIYTVVTPSLQA